MFITKTVLMLLTFLILIAVFLAKVSNLISVEVNDIENDDIKKYDVSTIRNQTISNKLDHIIWFIQVNIYNP